MSEYVDNVPQYESDEKNTGMASLAHILGLLTGFFGPLIMYLVADDEFVKKNSAKAFTWQVFLIVYFILSFFSMTFFIGLLLLPLLGILNVVFCVVGAIKAGDGKVWKYPGTVDLLESSEADTNMNKNSNNRNTQNTQQRNTRKNQNRKSNRANSEEELKQMYLDGEISDEEFEDRLDEMQSENEFDKSFN